MQSSFDSDPHGPMPILRTGTPLERATQALLLIHGRGATAESILPLSDHLGLPEGTHILAPQAFANSWYPYSFMAPREANQPGLDSALSKLNVLMQEMVAFLPEERIILGGFSQGACLASEFVAFGAYNPGGLLAFSGGVIGETVQSGTTNETVYGESGRETIPNQPPNSPLSAMRKKRSRIFLGCSDQDPHIPLHRVRETEEIFILQGHEVDCRIYPGMGHTINGDELSAARHLITHLFS